MPKVHSWIIKLVFYLNQLVRSIFLTAVKTLGAIQRPKRAKIGPKEGPKYKISYCEAKRDFKVSKIHSWDVKLVFYSKEATISIFLTIVIL